MAKVPRKMKVDAIAEAVCDLRFVSDEIPEAVIATFLNRVEWKQFKKARLPVAEIPMSVRQQDKNLMHQPTLELRHPDGKSLVRVGEQVVSLHKLAPYPGGDNFATEIGETLDFVYGSLSNVSITRIGLRYINVFTSATHGVNNVSDLNLKICVADEPLACPLNLNFKKAHGDSFAAMVKIATPEFVEGAVATPFSALVDVDVFTPSDYNCSDANAAKNWIGEARAHEKEEFFSLFTKAMQERLFEDE